MLRAWMREKRPGRQQRTYASVGEALGVGKVAVWFWARGTHVPTLEHRRAIARLTRGAVPVLSWERTDEAEAA